MRSKQTGRIELGRPSPALVVSCVALFVGLSGTAVALNANSVGSKELKRNAVRSKDVKNEDLKSKDLRNGKAVTGADVVDDSLGGVDIDESTLNVGQGGGSPTGPAGGSLAGQYPNPGLAPASVGTDQLAADAVDSAKVADGTLTGGDVLDGSLDGGDVANQGLTGQDVADGTLGAVDLDANSVDSGEIANGAVHAADLGPMVVRTAPFSVPPGNGGVFANCPAGERRISGGAVLPAGNGRGMQSSFPNGANGWTSIIRNNLTTDVDVTAYVLCLQG